MQNRIKNRVKQIPDDIKRQMEELFHSGQANTICNCGAIHLERDVLDCMDEYILKTTPRQTKRI